VVVSQFTTASFVLPVTMFCWEFMYGYIHLDFLCGIDLKIMVHGT
jgi:hypothetical protein